MIDVFNLAAPFFGLIFIVYVSLPALFYRILAKIPLEPFARVDFVFGTTLATFWAFSLLFGIGMLIRKGNIGESTIAGLAGGYGNIGDGLGDAGAAGGGAGGADLLLRQHHPVHHGAVPMVLTKPQRMSVSSIALEVVQRVAGHPLIIVSALGIASAAAHFGPPLALERLMQFLVNSAAPSALFAPLKKMPWEVPPLTAVKLLLHPALVFLLLSLFGPFDRIGINTAALPPALNEFVFARQYDCWVEQASSVLVGTPVSVVTLISVMLMVKSGALPPLLFR